MSLYIYMYVYTHADASVYTYICIYVYNFFFCVFFSVFECVCIYLSVVRLCREAGARWTTTAPSRRPRPLQPPWRPHEGGVSGRSGSRGSDRAHKGHIDWYKNVVYIKHMVCSTEHMIYVYIYMYTNIRIPQHSLSGIPLILTWKPECQIRLFMWSFLLDWAKGSCQMGASENWGSMIWGVLIIRSLRFGVLCEGP